MVLATDIFTMDWKNQYGKKLLFKTVISLFPLWVCYTKDNTSQSGTFITQSAMSDSFLLNSADSYRYSGQTS